MEGSGKGSMPIAHDIKGVSRAMMHVTSKHDKTRAVLVKRVEMG